MSTPNEPPPNRHYGRWVGALGLVILVLITLNTVLTKPNGAAGLAAGARLPPFALPLVTSDLQGDADIATHADDGEAGKHPACTLRGPRILNICQLYERGPVVLALFVDDGDCPRILTDMQTLAPSFPAVRFAAVSIKGSRAALRALVRGHRLSFPVGIDSDGVLATLYKVASCPQITFAYAGGIAEGKPLLLLPSLASLRARVAALLAASRARGSSSRS